MYQPFLDKINKAKSIVIFAHRSPDGDCYGASIALKEVILSNFKNKKVYLATSGLPNYFDLLGGGDAIDDEIINSSLGIIVDCSLFYRVEDQRVKNCIDLICIDHHMDNEEEGLTTIKDTNYNSTCEILVDMFKQLDFIINEKCASGLCLGILSDSGFCRFSKDFSKTFSSLSYLVDLGAKINDIIDISSIQNIDVLDFKSYLFSSYQVLNSGIIYIVLSKETLNQFNFSSSEALNYVNSIGNVTNYPIWIAFVEMDDGSMQVEFRGKNIDVHYIASLFNGGGHMFASGCRIKTFSLDKIDEILFTCENYLLDLSGDL